MLSFKNRQDIFRISAWVIILGGLLMSAVAFAVVYNWERQRLRAKRYQHPLSAIMADIDYFKNYNDVHGHLEGDVILKQIAELLRFHVRETDVVARFGGEEFLILLTETAKAEALEVAEKIRAAVSVRPFPHAGTQPEGKLTISLGVATSSADLSEARELISKADHALYVAKQAGRNRVREA